MEPPYDEQALIAGLRHGASGLLNTMAAVELLIETHQHTLSRLLDATPVRQCLHANEGDFLVVTVDWSVLGGIALGAMSEGPELPARSAQVCLIACELAYPDCCTGLPLTTLLSGLDAEHTRLVVRALQRHQGQYVA